MDILLPSSILLELQYIQQKLFSVSELLSMWPSFDRDDIINHTKKIYNKNALKNIKNSNTSSSTVKYNRSPFVAYEDMTPLQRMKARHEMRVQRYPISQVDFKKFCCNDLLYSSSIIASRCRNKNMIEMA